MIEAKFIGNSKINSYQTPDFNAGKSNIVSMKNSTWDDIKAKKDDKLFTNVKRVDRKFPEPKTIGPGI